MRNLIKLSSGDWFDPFEPDHRVLTPRVVARHLSNLCRYSGAKFLSVGEHSILVCDILERLRPANTTLHAWGLLHDAHEGISGLGDLQGLVKAVLPHEVKYFIKEHEERVDRAVQKAFGVHPLDTDLELLHLADVAARGVEMPFVFGTGAWTDRTQQLQEFVSRFEKDFGRSAWDVAAVAAQVAPVAGMHPGMVEAAWLRKWELLDAQLHPAPPVAFEEAVA